LQYENVDLEKQMAHSNHSSFVYKGHALTYLEAPILTGPFLLAWPCRNFFRFFNILFFNHICVAIAGMWILLLT